MRYFKYDEGGESPTIQQLKMEEADWTPVDGKRGYFRYEQSDPFTFTDGQEGQIEYDQYTVDGDPYQQRVGYTIDINANDKGLGRVRAKDKRIYRKNVGVTGGSQSILNQAAYPELYKALSQYIPGYDQLQTNGQRLEAIKEAVLAGNTDVINAFEKTQYNTETAAKDALGIARGANPSDFYWGPKKYVTSTHYGGRRSYGCKECGTYGRGISTSTTSQRVVNGVNRVQYRKGAVSPVFETITPKITMYTATMQPITRVLSQTVTQPPTQTTTPTRPTSRNGTGTRQSSTSTSTRPTKPSSTTTTTNQTGYYDPITKKVVWETDSVQTHRLGGKLSYLDFFAV